MTHSTPIRDALVLDQYLAHFPFESFERSFRVFAMCRSGQHAVINWILRMCREPIVAVNNLRSHVSDAVLVPDRVDIRGEITGSEAGCLVLNFEDYDLSRFAGEGLGARAPHFGPAADARDLIVLRDPYNLWASRLQRMRDRGPLDWRGSTVSDAYLERWKQMARACTGAEGPLPGAVCANYNRWFTSEDYRRELASELGLEFSDAGLEEVPVDGLGSSFDKRSHDGSAQQMRVLERYARFADDDEYLAAVGDPELSEMSATLFGLSFEDVAAAREN